MIYLKDNEIGVIRRGEPVQMLSLFNNEPSTINIRKLKLSLAQLEKGGYDTFMLKEIFEQPSTLRDCLRGRIVDNCRRVTLSGVDLNRGALQISRTHHSRGLRNIMACRTDRQASDPGLLQNACRSGICF